MKKTLIALGSLVVVLLMVSNATAVPQTNSQPVMKSIDQMEEIKESMKVLPKNIFDNLIELLNFLKTLINVISGVFNIIQKVGIIIEILTNIMGFIDSLINWFEEKQEWFEERQEFFETMFNNTIAFFTWFADFILTFLSNFSDDPTI